MAGKASGRVYRSRLSTDKVDRLRNDFEKGLNNASAAAMEGLDVGTVAYERDHKYDTPRHRYNPFSLV